MNREIYPGGLYPLSGDVQSQPGSTGVSVIGIQGIPVNSVTFVGGEVLAFSATSNAWVPILRATVQVNNATVSTDWIVSVNVPKPITVLGA